MDNQHCRKVLRMSILAVAMLVFAPLHAGDDRSGHPDAADVDVMVVGTPHLKQLKAAEMPSNDLIRDRLKKFEPDHVVVEWLHPSIDPATTGNYRAFEDLQALAQSWSYRLDDRETALARAREALATQKRQGQSVAARRVELGKQYYLNRDRLNAGYQWWIAERDGLDVADLKRLTTDNFRGHELEVWGFPIALAHDIDFITPFDYQGQDAEWNWDEIVQLVAFHAVSVKHGLKQGDEGWERVMEQYSIGMAAWATSGDATWFEEYASIPEVAEFADVVRIWTTRRSAKPPYDKQAGLAAMHYYQTPAHAADTRYLYDEVFPRISLDGLGQRLVDNWIQRNRRMADFVEQDLKRLRSQRVLVIVGEGHKPFLDAEFVRRGYNVINAAEVLVR